MKHIPITGKNASIVAPSREDDVLPLCKQVLVFVTKYCRYCAAANDGNVKSTIMLPAGTRINLIVNKCIGAFTTEI